MRMAPRRPWAAAVLVAAGALAATSAPSFAKDPVRTHPPIPPIRISRSVCGFPVLVKTVANREVVKTYPDGHMVITGQLKQTMTNVRDGHQITISVGGPARIYTTEDTFVLKSSGTAWIAQWGFGVRNFLRETHGQVVDDDSGLRVVHGTSRNLCPVLR